MKISRSDPGRKNDKDANLPLKDIPVENTDILIWGVDGIKNLTICWHTQARLAVLQHAYTTPDVEIGGLLLGGFYRSHDRDPDTKSPIDFVEIEVALPARGRSSSATHFQFAHETWADLHRRIDAEFPDLEIVGWYHSHPGHGIFLSGWDLDIQNNHFTRKYSLALLIETFEHKGAFFIGNKAHQGGPQKGQEFIWDRHMIQNMLGSPESRIYREIAIERQKSTFSNSVPEHTPEYVDNMEPEIMITEDDMPLERTSHHQTQQTVYQWREQNIQLPYQTERSSTVRRRRQRRQQINSLLRNFLIYMVIACIVIIVSALFVGIIHFSFSEVYTFETAHLWVILPSDLIIAFLFYLGYMDLV